MNLEVITKKEALARGMRSITDTLHPKTDRHVIESMDRGMVGTTAAWVRHEPDGFLEMFRARRELREIEKHNKKVAAAKK